MLRSGHYGAGTLTALAPPPHFFYPLRWARLVRRPHCFRRDPMSLRLARFAAAITAAILVPLAGCGTEAPAPSHGSTGGAPISGGSAGVGTGGVNNTGGLVSTGGVGTGGTTGTTGGTTFAGGASGTTGGISTGGVATGGVSTGGTAAGTGGSAGSTVPATWDTVHLVLTGTTPQCASAGCHGAGGMVPPGRPLTLADDDQLYTHLTSYTSVACGNVPLINLSNPAESGLVKILKGPCGMTPQMPNGCTVQDGNCVPQEYITAIQQWIANGAPKQ